MALQVLRFPIPLKTLATAYLSIAQDLQVPLLAVL